jgi:hypothetical protein
MFRTALSLAPPGDAEFAPAFGDVAIVRSLTDLQLALLLELAPGRSNVFDASRCFNSSLLITDELIAAAARLSHIDSFRLQGCTKLSDQAMISIAKVLFHLLLSRQGSSQPR